MHTTLDRLTRRLRQGDFYLAVGRFGFARKTYSFYQHGRQQFRADFYRSRLNPHKVSAFADASPAVHVQSLRERGVSFGFWLPPSAVAQVY